ncbi:MAG TPA: HEAT repeat domain-containing protein, partial [Planctomycetaceae bacterium]
MHLTSHVRRSVVLLAAFSALVFVSSRQVNAQGPDPEKEAEFIAVLRSDAPGAEKAIACKQLAIYGSRDAVVYLARLLPDEKLASWARIALEAIPGSEADEALRKATDSLQGNLLIGTINSIGVRRDAAAVELLSSRLPDQDAEVASAAAAALGRIGNLAAAKLLRNALAGAPVKVRSAVAEGCVLCAERFLAEGRPGEAVEIYDQVRKADVPQQRILEATRGAILSRKKDGLSLLLEQFRSPDKALFNIGLSTAREFPGSDVDQALATELARAQPERGALIVLAMADRPATVVLPAVLKAAASGPRPVRLAAIGALGRVGDSTCLPLLLDALLEADADLVQSARETLGELRGEKVDAEIVAQLSKAKGKIYPLLIEIVGQRRIEATAELLKALDNSEKATRSAALTALGATVAPKGLSILVAQVVSPKHAEDAETAQAALRTASTRMPDREACATELALALDRAPAPTKNILLEILSEVGGTKALGTVGAAAKSTNPEMQDTGSKLLGKWSTEDAAPVLLDLAKTAREDKYHVRAIRGYIGLARKFVKTMPEPQRLEMFQNAFETCRHPADKKLVLAVLRLDPSLATLKLAIKALQQPELKEDATQTALVIAQKIGGTAPETRELLSKAGIEPVKLEIIKAEYGAGAAQKDVTEILKKLVG